MISVVSLAVTARLLGPEGRGIIAAATGWVGLFTSCGYLSLGQVALHTAAKSADETWLGPTFGSLVFMTCVVTLAGWVVATGLYVFTGGGLFNGLSPSVLLLAFLALPLMIWESYGSSLLMAVNRLRVYNSAQLVGRSASFLAQTAAILLGGGVLSVLGANLLGQGIVSAAGLRDLVARTKMLRFFHGPTLRGLLAGGAKLHLNAIGSVIVGSSQVLIINYFRGPEETAYYQLASQLVGVLMIVPHAASMVLFTEVAQAGPDGAWLNYRRIVFWTTLGVAGMSLAAALVGPWLILLVAGQKFIPAVRPFQLLLLTLIGMSLTFTMAPQWIGRGLFWQVSALALIVGGSNLVGSLVLVPKYGMYGAIWVTLVTYAVTVLVNGGLVLWCELRFRQQSSAKTALDQPVSLRRT